MSVEMENVLVMLAGSSLTAALTKHLRTLSSVLLSLMRSWFRLLQQYLKNKSPRGAELDLRAGFDALVQKESGFNSLFQQKEKCETSPQMGMETVTAWPGRSLRDTEHPQDTEQPQGIQWFTLKGFIQWFTLKGFIQQVWNVQSFALWSKTKRWKKIRLKDTLSALPNPALEQLNS